MKKSLAWLMVILLLIIGPGCGYRLAGGGFINNDVARVSVAIFDNKTSESRAGISFTNELIREITAKTDTIVVGDGNATRKITGTIRSISFSTLSRSSTEDVTERQVYAVVDVVLTGAGGKVLWSVKSFSATESYKVSNSSVDDEANKREAVDLIAERVAERIISQMTNDF
ncbi:LptE family protein [Desulfobacter curvatus]|uniref:LPS assembly lipoprotein LptE n=1 Tax=Desulfobacter curvatus TaxID=2290 RepID=UPI00037D7DD9|nr:LptE family protein [Desulfobacter curvatus]